MAKRRKKSSVRRKGGLRKSSRRRRRSSGSRRRQSWAGSIQKWVAGATNIRRWTGQLPALQQSRGSVMTVNNVLGFTLGFLLGPIGFAGWIWPKSAFGSSMGYGGATGTTVFLLSAMVWPWNRGA